MESATPRASSGSFLPPNSKSKIAASTNSSVEPIELNNSDHHLSKDLPGANTINVHLLKAGEVLGSKSTLNIYYSKSVVKGHLVAKVILS